MTRAALCAALLIAAALGHPAAAAAVGVAVDEVHAGFGGEQAGLKPGDVLLRWSRAANPPVNPAPARGDFHSQFDFVEVELEQAPRGALTFEVARDGGTFTIEMPRQDWVVSVRPVLDEAVVGPYREARRLIDGEAPPAGFAAWRAMARAFRAEGRDDLARWLHLKLARFAALRADWPTADAAFQEALDASAGDAGAQAQIHGFAAESRAERLEWDAAVAGYEKALEVQRGRGADTLHEARIHDQLGSVALKHGDLLGADQHLRRGLDIREKAAPGSAAVANSLHNLGLVAAARGDLAAAEDFLQRSLALTQALAPDTLNASLSLHNLGGVAEQRGDLTAAERYYTRALEYWSRNLPVSAGMASGMVNLAAIALKTDRAAAARELAPRAYEIAEAVHPGGIVSGDAALVLGDVAAAGGEEDAAAAWYRRALEIRQAQLPGSAAEAEAYQRLGALERRRKRPAEAIPLYLKALDLLDGQRRRLGGTDEVRSRFAARYAPYYHDTLDLLMESGRPEDAFHVLERYRARAFLELLAERDLVFSADVPKALDDERRAVRAEYDRAFAAVAGATGPASADARRALDDVRRRQGDVEARVRAASPRLAALQHPEPLDLARTRAVLDPGTLLLSYAAGERASYLFAVGPGPADFLAVKLDTTLPKLRAEVGRFRQFLQERSVLGRRPLRAVAERLTAALLAPAADRLSRAERVVILPDGPLHLVPFAALADPTSVQPRFLVEARPLSTAASATVLGELRKGRPARRRDRLVAFGDPDYRSPAPGAASIVRSLRERGLELAPLPGSRLEVEALAGLYTDGARVHLGAAASEERARRAGGEPSLLHFACHALADEGSPLDSALVLSLPAAWKAGQPNGLLQAWEILEQVRIDADLVTLSACGTGLGREMSGEGMIGLTRAFQYAGARTVLASLWSVNDESTADLMGRFYRRLRRGESKDAALRAAQAEMIATPRFAHPALWAAFQLSGDWR